MTADLADGFPGDDRQPDDLPAVPHRRLRAALEFAVAVAGEAARRHVRIPAGLADLVHRQRLSVTELGRARRAIVAAPEFRERVGAAAGEGVVDELGRVWLSRPPGWTELVTVLLELDDEREQRNEAEQALRREQKRRRSAERKRDQVASHADLNDDRVEKLAEQVTALRTALDEARAAQATLRAELTERSTAERHAADRQRAAETQRDALAAELEVWRVRAAEAEAARDRLLAERADGRGSLSGSSVADLRRVGEQLSRLAADVRAAVTPPADRRTPIAVPGSKLGDVRATAEHLLRADAAVIVDGYNVAKLMWPGDELAEQRRRLLDAVDNVARRYGSGVIVVFDGADVVGATADRRRLSRVVYSPAGVIADDVIRDEVGAIPAWRTIVVVTDDREIQRDVTKVGANVLSSQAFATVARG